MIEYTVKVYKNRTEWWLNGSLHRENGPAREWSDGKQEWWLNDNLHREDGPAVIYPNGYKAWYVNGLHHREDGPAVIYPNGYKAWWLNDIEVTEEEFNSRNKNKKEMTVAEIEEQLGYSIKIVK